MACQPKLVNVSEGWSQWSGSLYQSPNWDQLYSIINAAQELLANKPTILFSDHLDSLLDTLGLQVCGDFQCRTEVSTLGHGSSFRTPIKSSKRKKREGSFPSRF